MDWLLRVNPFENAFAGWAVFLIGFGLFYAYEVATAAESRSWTRAAAAVFLVAVGIPWVAFVVLKIVVPLGLAAVAFVLVFVVLWVWTVAFEAMRRKFRGDER